MKISLMTLNYLPNKGGLVSYVQNISKEIAKSSHSTVVHTTDGKNRELPELERIDGIQVYRHRVLSMKGIFKLFTPFLVPLKLYSRFKLNLDKDEYVIIRHLYFAMALSLFKKRDNFIYIIPLIAPRLQRMNIKQVNTFKKMYYYFLIPQLYLIEKFALNRIKNIATLSDTKKEEIVEFYNISSNKVHVIPPGVDLEKFKPLVSQDEKETILKNEGLEVLKEFKIILTVCRLSNEKNVTYAIDMISHMGEGFKLVIVGDGEESSKLKKYVIDKELDDKVIFVGFKSNTEDFYRIADVFILPSKYEGFGHVYLEAMASGIPCIGLQHNPPNIITATQEIIKQNQTGFIDKGENSEELANKLISWFQNPLLVQEYRKNCRTYVEENHSWNTHLTSIISLWEMNERGD